MDRRRTKTMVSRLLRQSILELCKASVPQEQGIEIDGIVCISIGNEDEQIVVKVHEQLGALRTIRDATSSQSHLSPSQKIHSSRSNGHSESTPRSNDTSPVIQGSEYEKKRQNLHLIASAASAKKLKISHHAEPEESVGSSTSTPKRANTPSHELASPTSILTAIKTEVLSDEENPDSESSSTQTPQPSTSQPAGSAQNSSMERYLGNASLDTVVFRDLECEHCKLLLPTFEKLKEHNVTEHKANTCGYCWRSFLNFDNYQQHLRSHRKMRVKARGSGEHKDMTSKRKKCGECQEVFRSFSLIIEHLRTVHQYEKCLTCITCEEYFPNRQSFVLHRKTDHSDVQQCRCENCEVYFTYVEFKHHERECFGADTNDRDSCKSKRPIQQRSKLKEEADSVQIVKPIEDIPSEVINVTAEGIAITSISQLSARELQLEAENVLGQILESEHSILEQTKALVSVKTKEPERIRQLPYSHPGSASYQHADVEIVKDRSVDDDGDDDDEEDEQDGESENADSEEASIGDGDASEILNSLDASNQGNKSWDFSYPRSVIKEKATALACQGPYRCQTCYYVVEKFEDFERHCYEMHSRYVCTYCAQTFANRRNLQRHIRRHIGDMPYVCDECGQRFYRDDNLRRHKLKHITSVKFCCAYCSAPCETKNKLTSHLIGGHTIDVLKVTEQEIMKHIVLKDGTANDRDFSEMPQFPAA